LHWHGQLAQETLYDGSAFGKLVLHLNLQHIRGQRHKIKALCERNTKTQRKRLQSFQEELVTLIWKK